jgi:hypothetical protein
VVSLFVLLRRFRKRLTGLFSFLLSDPIVIRVQTHYRESNAKTLTAVEEFFRIEDFKFRQ